MVFSHDTITKKVLEKHVFLNNTEGLFVELNSKNVNGYLVEHTIHILRAMNVFSKILIKLQILMLSMKKCYFLGVLTQKYLKIFSLYAGI